MSLAEESVEVEASPYRQRQSQVYEPERTKNLANKTCKRNKKPRNVALSGVVSRGSQKAQHRCRQLRIYCHKAVLSSDRQTYDHNMQKKNMQSDQWYPPFAMTSWDRTSYPSLFRFPTHNCTLLVIFVTPATWSFFKGCSVQLSKKKSIQIQIHQTKKLAISLDLFTTEFHAIHPATSFILQTLQKNTIPWLRFQYLQCNNAIKVSKPNHANKFMETKSCKQKHASKIMQSQNMQQWFHAKIMQAKSCKHDHGQQKHTNIRHERNHANMIVENKSCKNDHGQNLCTNKIMQET